MVTLGNFFCGGGIDRCLLSAVLLLSAHCPGPNFPLVNYLRHNGHSAAPDFAKAVVVASAAARAAKTKIICPRVSPWIAAVVVGVHVDKNGPFPASV